MNNLYPNQVGAEQYSKKGHKGHTPRGTSEKVTRIKLNPKEITLKGVNILIILAIAVFVIAQTNEELEAEKALLEQELVVAGYNWLANQQYLNTLKEVDTYLKRGIK